MGAALYVQCSAPMPDIVRIDRLKIFLDSMGGGAWPFLVGGVICLVNRNIAREMLCKHSGPRAQADQNLWSLRGLANTGVFECGCKTSWIEGISVTSSLRQSRAELADMVSGLTGVTCAKLSVEYTQMCTQLEERTATLARGLHRMSAVNTRPWREM